MSGINTYFALKEIRELENFEEKAICLHEKYNIPIIQIAKYLNISRSKLNRAIKAHKQGRPSGVVGRPTVLTELQEKKLVEHIKERNEHLDSMTIGELQNEIAKLRTENMSEEMRGNVPRVNSVWIKNFLERNELKEVIPHRLEHERIIASHSSSLFPWCEGFEKFCSEHQFRPELIAKFDETMLSTKNGKMKVIIPADRRHGTTKIQKTKEHITLGATLFADGTMTTSIVIFPLKNLPNDLIEFLENDAYNFAYAGKSTGRMTKEIFASYIEKNFISEINHCRSAMNLPNAPALLLVDGHDSRNNAKLLRKLRDENIFVVKFLSHTTHIFQPCDVGFFTAFKQNLLRLKRNNHGASDQDKRKTLLQLAAKAIRQSSFQDDIQMAWKKTGIFPLDLERMKKHDFIIPDDENCEETPSEKEKKIRIAFDNTCMTREELMKMYEEKDTQLQDHQLKKRNKPIKKTEKNMRTNYPFSSP